jgi:hypothetical protein
MGRTKKSFKKKRAAIFLLSSIFSMALIFSMYCFFEGVASPKIVGLTITSHKFFFKSSYILSLYAFQLKLHNWIGEQNIGSMPPELDRYLIDLLRSDSSHRIRIDIINFYLELTSELDFCCGSFFESEDKKIIGDIIQYTKHSDSSRKMRAIRVMEAIRIEGGLPSKCFIEPELEPDDIEAVFTIYENWWGSSLPLREKLNTNPLKSDPYFWNTF